MAQDKNFRKKQTIVMLLFILLFAFVIRWETLVQPRDFWIDESFQYEISKKPISFILDSPDVHPPLFNLFTKTLLFIGIDNPFHLRLIMVMLSLILISEFFFTIKEIFNRNIAFYSSMLLSFCLTYIYYATEFRSYTFTLIFVILQIKYFNRILNVKEFNHEHLWLTLFSALMIYSHYLSGLILVAQAIFLAVNWKKIHLYRQTAYLSSLIFLFFASMPLMIYLVRTIPKIQSFWFKDIDFLSLISTFSYILAPPMQDGILYLIFYPILISLIIIYRKKFDLKIQQFLYYLIIPIILMWTISQIIPFYHHRYFLFGGLSIFVLLGWAFDRLDSYKKDLGVFMVGMWLVIAFISFPSFIATFNTELYETSLNLSNIKDSDTLVHTTTFSYLPFLTYFPKNNQYLMTNLTTQQIFTVGGSIVNPENIKHDLSFVSEINGSVYGISDKPIFPTEIINVRGLYVTKHKK